MRPHRGEWTGQSLPVLTVRTQEAAQVLQQPGIPTVRSQRPQEGSEQNPDALEGVVSGVNRV